MGSFYGERYRVEADRARQDERARRERIEASAVRDRLEKQSGRGLPRAGLGLALAKIEAADRAGSGDVSTTLDALRKLAGRSRSRFDHERAGDFVAPELRAPRVRDAEGGLHGGVSTEDGANDGSDHWAGYGVRDAMVDTLTVEDMKHIASMRWKNRFW